MTLVTLALGLIAWAGTPAVANQNVGATGGTGCDDLNRHDPNDSVIGYQRTALSTDLHNAVEWVMTWDVTPTDREAGAASSGGDFRYVDGTYTTFCGKTGGSRATE